MGIRKTRFFWLAALWVVCSTGCTSEEEAPLTDGLHFEYHHNISTVTIVYDITFKEVDDEHFLLNIGLTADGETAPNFMEIPVDRFLRTESGDRAELEEAPLWLPSSQRRKGAKVVASGDTFTMRKETTWEGWDVWMAYWGNLYGSVELYYARDTGFLVGLHVVDYGRLKLVDTNAPGMSR